MCFAGLWETWQAPESEAVQTTTILTTQANRGFIIAPPSHAGDAPSKTRLKIGCDRMSQWIRRAYSHLGLVEELKLHCVSAAMNKPNYDQPDCITPIEANHSEQRELF